MHHFNSDGPPNHNGHKLDDEVKQDSISSYSGKIKPQQHNRLYLKDIVQEFKDGLMSRSALVWNWLKLRIAQGWELYVSYESFLQEMQPCFEAGKTFSRATYYRALDRLENLGYIAIHQTLSKVERLFVEPLPMNYQRCTVPRSTGVSQGSVSPDFQCGLKNETAVSDMRQASQKCDEASPKPKQERISSDLSNDASASSSNFSGERKETNDSDHKIIPNEPVQQATQPKTKVKSKPRTQPKKLAQDKNSASNLQKRSKTDHWALQYDGNNTPWLNPPHHQHDINFNQTFLLWHGERFMQRYEKLDIPSAVADFETSLLNQPHKISVRWKEYERYLISKLKNIKTLINNGLSIREDERRLIDRHWSVLTRFEQVKGLLNEVMPQLQPSPPEMRLVEVEMPDFKELGESDKR